jgi:hypothetical protein
MRPLFEIIIGALVFIGIDRLSKLISSSIVDKNHEKKEMEKTMLRIEITTLFLALFIATHFM